MAYPLGLTAKSLAGIAGAFSATTGGVLLFNIGGNSVPEKIIEKFEKRVEKVIGELGVDKDWCTKKEKEDKYVCAKEKSGENLKKIVFASRHNSVDRYDVQNNPTSVEMEIVDSKDFETFPDGVKFVILGNGNNSTMTIKRSTKNWSEWSQEQVGIWAKGGELKVLNGKMIWVWEEVNDLAVKLGMWCTESDKKCTYQNKKNKKMNVMDGKKNVLGVTMDSKKTLSFDRGQNGFFQGYKFVPQSDIQLLRGGGKISGPITKLEINKPYQIARDSKNETKWYLSKVGK